MRRSRIRIKLPASSYEERCAARQTKYMVITAYGKDWQSKALVFDDPRKAAKAWLKHDMGIRLLIDGEIHHGTYEQMRPIYNELAQLEEGAA